MTGVNGPVEDLTGGTAGQRADDEPAVDEQAIGEPAVDERAAPDARRDRVVVVTGATSGIGLAAAVALARRGDRVAVVGRDPERLRAAGARVREVARHTPALFQADFGVLDDVRRLAEELRRGYDRIDVLANNAGALVARPVITVDGFELTMQANHLAPFLLTNLLRDRLDRVVATASVMYRTGAVNPDDLSAGLRDYRPMRAYASSKQANILCTAEAARRWPGVLSTSYHPGVARTRFGGGTRLLAFGMKVSLFLPGPARGARTLVWLAEQDRAALVNGGYYARQRLLKPLPKATDAGLAARLWRACEQAVGLA